MKVELHDKDKINQFLTIIKNLKTFSAFITLDISNKDDNSSIYIQGMDSSQVSLFEIKLMKDWFYSFDVSENDEKEISVSTEIFYKILNTYIEGQTIIIKNSQENNEKLEIEFVANDEIKDVYDKFFEIPIMERNIEKLDIPDVEYEADFSFPSTIMTTIMEEMSIFNENVNLFCSEDSIKITASGTEGKMETSIPIESLDSFSIEEDKTLSLPYSLQYVNNIMSFN